MWMQFLGRKHTGRGWKWVSGVSRRGVVSQAVDEGCEGVTLEEGPLGTRKWRTEGLCPGSEEEEPVDPRGPSGVL